MYKLELSLVLNFFRRFYVYIFLALIYIFLIFIIVLSFNG